MLKNTENLLITNKREYIIKYTITMGFTLKRKKINKIKF